MRVGFIGAGTVTGTFGRHLITAGHTVVVSNSRGPETLANFVVDLGPGAIAGTREQAAECDVVILATNWVNVPEALKGIDWRGRILIDATNAHMDPKPDISLAGVTRSRAALKGRTSSEMVAKMAVGAPASKIDQQHADGLDTGLLGQQAPYRDLYIRRRHRSQTASDRVDQ
jgi:predicted dinucleotide-binding enzyme